jgi:hypothetical protein
VPLVFLDVDGALLPFGAGAAAVDPDSPLTRIDPRLGPRLAALPARLVWATTWMREANELVAPRLGLPELPVLDPLPATPEDAWFGLHWKTRAVVAHAAGRAFAWVDDEITAADREWVDDRHPGPALLLRVDPATGMTARDLDDLQAWLAAPRG